MDVSVSVTDGTDPVEGATVTLIDSEEEEYTGTTGSAGGCTIKDVPEGTYTVTATATGFTDYEDEDVEISDESKTLSITMTETITEGTG